MGLRGPSHTPTLICRDMQEVKEQSSHQRFPQNMGNHKPWVSLKKPISPLAQCSQCPCTTLFPHPLAAFFSLPPPPHDFARIYFDGSVFLPSSLSPNPCIVPAFNTSSNMNKPFSPPALCLFSGFSLFAFPQGLLQQPQRGICSSLPILPTQDLGYTAQGTKKGVCFLSTDTLYPCHPHFKVEAAPFKSPRSGREKEESEP